MKEEILEVRMFQIINGFKMRVMVKGQGPTIVMLHGNGEDQSIFKELKLSLMDTFQIYTYDARNHGESEKGLPMSYEMMAEDLNAFLEAYDLKDVCVLGFSDGGIITLHSTINQNPRITKQILLGTNLSLDALNPKELVFMQETYEESKDVFTKLMLDQTPISFEQCKSIKIPTAIVYGEDEPFTKRSIDEIHKAIPNSSLTIVKGHDHGSYINRSAYLSDFIKRFLI